VRKADLERATRHLTVGWYGPNLGNDRPAFLAKLDFYCNCAPHDHHNQ
jgi:hypothetical protein